MAKFVVYTKIRAQPAEKREMDVMACMEGTAWSLKKAGIKDVKLIKCFCCTPPEAKEFMMELEAPNKESLSKALEKIDIPVKSITEVTEVKLKQ